MSPIFSTQAKTGYINGKQIKIKNSKNKLIFIGRQIINNLLL